MSQQTINAVPNIDTMNPEMQHMLKEKLATNQYVDKGGRFRWNKLMKEDFSKAYDKYSLPTKDSTMNHDIIIPKETSMSSRLQSSRRRGARSRPQLV